jgi:hypothetical protein
MTLLVLGLGALIKRRLEHSEKRSMMRKEQEIASALEARARAGNGPHAAGVPDDPRRKVAS